jgi:hypothetical protein
LGLASELCQIVGHELFFFTWHTFLEVGKTKDLLSKIWQTLGDALRSYLTMLLQDNTRLDTLYMEKIPQALLFSQFH